MHRAFPSMIRNELTSLLGSIISVFQSLMRSVRLQVYQTTDSFHFHLFFAKILLSASGNGPFLLFLFDRFSFLLLCFPLFFVNGDIVWWKHSVRIC